MTYSEVLTEVAKATEYPKGICEAVCNALFEEVAKGINKEDEVKLTNFGRVYLRTHPPKRIFDVSIQEYRVRPPVKKLDIVWSPTFKSIVWDGRNKYDAGNNEDE